MGFLLWITDGSVYICGCGDRTPVPATAADVKPSEGKCEKLHEIACNMVSQLQGADVLKQQACYLPTSPDGIPILGELPSHPGVFLATGHSCWGILNGPGTGKVMAGLFGALPILTQTASFNLRRKWLVMTLNFVVVIFTRKTNKLLKRKRITIFRDATGT